MTQVIDFHTHVWPDAIAARAVNSAVEDMERMGDGRVSSLVESMADAGIDQSVCLGIAHRPDTVPGVNRFAGSLPAPLVGFGAVHPDIPPDVAVESLRSNGLGGVKIHPLLQGFPLDAPGLQPILDALQGEFPVVIHVGGATGFDDWRSSAGPQEIARLVREFPRLEIVAAHFGCYLGLDWAEELVVGLPVFIDTSWPPTMAEHEPERLRALIRRHGVERVVWGSDWPVAIQRREIDALVAVGLDDDETAAILGGNAAALLNRDRVV